MARRGENIYKRKDGRWEGRYKDGADSFGKTKYRSVYARTYSEVKAKLISRRSAQGIEPDSKLTIKVLFDEWLSSVQLRVKPSTYANYTMKLSKHILPVFGSLRYEQVTVRAVHGFIESKLREGLSPKYVADIVILIKAMSKYVSRVYGCRNILEEVILPKAPKTERIILTAAQQITLCRYLKSNLSPTNICILLSLYTGLRIGEICGLMWSDISLEKSIIVVR